MPIYEYECRACRHRFEEFVRPSSTSTSRLPECPSCHSQELQRLFSAFAVDSAGTKQAHLTQARKLNRKVIRDKEVAEAEQMKRAHDDHTH